MLTNKEKQKLVHKWICRLNMCGQLPETVHEPKIGCVYAAEMSDNTTKIGVSQDADRRIKEIKQQVYLDVKRVHHTDYAPFDFMTKLEKTCHAAFADRRVRGEFFDISFEEAVAELDSHAEEIIAVRKAADEKLLDEINFFFNEFLPNMKKCPLKKLRTRNLKTNWQ